VLTEPPKDNAKEKSLKFIPKESEIEKTTGSRCEKKKLTQTEILMQKAMANPKKYIEEKPEWMIRREQLLESQEKENQ
jgi:hypothetical protein